MFVNQLILASRQLFLMQLCLDFSFLQCIVSWSHDVTRRQFRVLSGIKTCQHIHTYDVSYPSGVTHVSNKWVRKVKYRHDGLVEQRNARLVVRGFTQQHDTKYEETFTPVAQMATVWLLFVVATQFWSLYQMNVETVFLHDIL